MKTLILSAMELETSKVKAMLKGKSYINNIDILNTGIGKVFAVSALQKYLIEHKDIKNIVLIGFAGALKPEFKKGELVFVRGAIQHDFGILKNGKLFKHRAGYINLNSNDNIDILHKLSYSEDIFKPQIKTGIIATGDIFANDTVFSKNLSKEADLVDMETGAITQLLEKYYPDMKLYSLRVVSDSASDSADKEFSVSVKTMLTTLTAGAEKVLDFLYS